ncbi:MAG: hypothetical protein IJT21_08385 [Synergistaceae bacterium]|nr:hypothetical protein [Synergistaceae bacterium]
MLARLYNSFVLGLLISVILSQNEWLEMRINIGWVFFALVIVLFLIMSVLKIFSSFTASLVSVIISCAGIWYLTGSEGVKIIPASIIREGIMQRNISFEAINYALIAVIIAGLVLTFLFRHEH